MKNLQKVGPYYTRLTISESIMVMIWEQLTPQSNNVLEKRYFNHLFHINPGANELRKTIRHASNQRIPRKLINSRKSINKNVLYNI